jgi:Raf kinase inhibitor-like YbhB/YbcL family protein
MPRSRWLIVRCGGAGVLAAVALLLAACGRRDAPPDAGPPQEATGANEEETAMATPTFVLTSSAFTAGGTIPRVHTCDDRDISPPLSWQGMPEGAVSLALLCDDPDAPRGTWVHWVLYDLAPTVSELAAGVAATETVLGGVRQGRNDFRKIGYGGPCPPPGPAHRYFFRLLALDKKLDLPPGVTMRQVLDAAAGHTLARAELMGRYGR